ncbi:hypothetical protein FACS1894137_15930 [Spirochaetia bacterium]|nr:hypothetical protein FACS1894137_15930 [Spirochaetia bacterium]
MLDTREALTLRLEGLTIDTLYENFIRQIARERLDGRAVEDIGGAVSRDEQRRKLAQEIAMLEKKVKAEKQSKVKLQAKYLTRQLSQYMIQVYCIKLKLKSSKLKLPG